MGIHAPGEKIADAKTALWLLREGNRRYLEGAHSDKSSHAQDRAVLKDGQNPFAVVVCCSDSRVPPEIFFDQKLGNIFVVRNAGNVIDSLALGSIEYAVHHLGCPLVVVCGHSSCGAVSAAVDGHALGPNVQTIAEHIRPSAGAGGHIDEVSRHHVARMVARLEANPALGEAGTAVAGAYYDIASGEVSWLS